MKILMLPRYDRLGASSRLRLYQYLPFFEANGYETRVEPLFGNEYIKSLYSGKIKIIYVIHAYLKRLRVLFNSSKYDIIFLEKEFFPWIPAWLELLMVSKSTRVVVDYDDAVFHRYDEHKNIIIRKLLGRKIDGVMKYASLVFAGNKYLGNRAVSAGCAKVEIIPTVIDLNRYDSNNFNMQKDKLKKVGWIGSPSTAPYLKLVSNAVRELDNHDSIRFIAIGARDDQVQSTPFEAVEWSEDTEVEEIMGFDIGIMPLLDEPWERGKCGYKLIQYMACSVAVIASPVGVNNQIVQPSVNGFICNSDAEWRHSISALLDDPDARTRMGRAGREMVEKEYCVQVQAPRIIAFFDELMTGQRC